MEQMQIRNDYSTSKNNLNYLIDRTFTNVTRLFVLSFTWNNAGANRDSFSHYYTPNVEIKDFNVLINGKSFFDLPVKRRSLWEHYQNEQ